MTDVVSTLNLSLYRDRGNVADYYCPFCEANGKHHHSLNINFEKETFNCYKCGYGGGLLQLYSAYQQVVVRNSDYIGHYKSSECTKQAAADMLEALGQNQQKTASENQKRKKLVEEKRTLHSDINFSKTNLVYNCLIDNISLTVRHRQDLLDRGMSEESIKKYRLRSVPTTFGGAIVKKISEQTGITDFSGVAGFYFDEQTLEWSMTFQKYHKGILIPYYDYDGNITSFQIRLDTPLSSKNDKPTRYISFSSVYRNKGTSASSTPCYLHGTKRNNILYVTEGGLKAMVAQSMTGWSFVALQGVANQKGLEELLGRFQGNIVYDTFDMDYHTNVNVQKEKKKLEAKIVNAGKTFKRAEWNAEYKGIDDYLLALKKSKNKL